MPFINSVIGSVGRQPFPVTPGANVPSGGAGSGSVTPWAIDDIGQSTYSNISLDLSTEEPNTNNIQGITMSGDGTKLFVTSSGIDSVIEYAMSTPFDIGTAIWQSNHTFTAQFHPTGFNNWGIEFNNDGSSVVISSGGQLYQYNLSVNYDLSSGNYNQNDGAFYTTENYSIGLRFSNDGSHLYISGPGSDKIKQYSLPTPGVITNAVDTGKELNLATLYGNDNPGGFSFNSNGTKLFVMMNSPVRIQSFNLTVPFDISTAYVAGDVLNLAGTVFGTGLARGIHFSNDGSKFFAVNSTSITIDQFDTVTSVPATQSHLWTILDISTSTDDNVTFDTSNEDTFPRGVQFKPDGTKMYMIGNQHFNDQVHEYDLSIPWDISTATVVHSTDLVAIDSGTNPYSLYIKPDGTKFYTASVGTSSLREYDMTTPWDISTATALPGGATYSTLQLGTTNNAFVQGITFSPDGSKCFYSAGNGDDIVQLTLSTPWSLATASFSKSYDTQQIDPADSNIEASPGGLHFNSDGSKLYMQGRGNHGIYQFRLLVPYDIGANSIIYENLYTIGDTKGALAFSSDGTKMYTSMDTQATIRQHTTIPSYGAA